MCTYYDILELSSLASMDEIQKSYEKLKIGTQTFTNIGVIVQDLTHGSSPNCRD